MISLSASDWLKMINNEKSSDVILVVKNKSFYCHKTILSMHSEYFQQSSTNWKSEERIALDELPCAESMASVLGFLYNQPVTINCPIHFANVYYTANYLMIDVIKDKIKENYLQDIESNIALKILLYYQETNVGLDDVIDFCCKRIRDKITDQDLDLLYKLDPSVFATISFPGVTFPVHYVYKLVSSCIDMEQYLLLLSLIDFHKAKYAKPEIVLKAFLMLSQFSNIIINDDREENEMDDESDLIKSYSVIKHDLYITVLERIVNFDPFMAELDVDRFVDLVAMFPREQRLHLALTFYNENMEKLQLPDCQKLLAVAVKSGATGNHDQDLSDNDDASQYQNPYNLTQSMIDPVLNHYAILSDLPYLTDLLEYKKQAVQSSEYVTGQHVDAYDREARGGAQWISAIIVKRTNAHKYKVSFLGWSSNYDTELLIRDIAPRYTKCHKRIQVTQGETIEVLVAGVWKKGEITLIKNTNMVIQVLEGDENQKVHVRNYEFSEMVCPYRTHILNR